MVHRTALQQRVIHPNVTSVETGSPTDTLEQAVLPGVTQVLTINHIGKPSGGAQGSQGAHTPFAPNTTISPDGGFQDEPKAPTAGNRLRTLSSGHTPAGQSPPGRKGRPGGLGRHDQKPLGPETQVCEGQRGGHVSGKTHLLQDPRQLMDLSSPRCSLRRGLLLVASLLACGICQASGQIFIPHVQGVQGYSSVLGLENAPEDAQEYRWYRGTQDIAESMILSYKPPSPLEPGPMYSGRERVTRTGNLVVRNCMLNDTGNYTVRVDTGNGTHTATGWLEIQVLGSNPGISVNATSLVESMDSVAAYCHTNVTSVTWYLNAVPTSSSNRISISPDGKTLVILRVSRYDRTLQCAVESYPEVVQKSKEVALTVAYGPDNVVLWGSPDIFNGILTAQLGSQVEVECVSTSRPSST
ncbi:cell adhesion molecule CEACAM18-like [Microcebus murinus]|uniref:cell adhesion molecule CEACAM18-like n=1 Tax=Microcebus murinus TaxID=30608 RepID=UPI003F6AF0AF